MRRYGASGVRLGCKAEVRGMELISENPEEFLMDLPLQVHVDPLPAALAQRTCCWISPGNEPDF